jgi:peptidoglycan hydrolase-like protein with peptidoglycan-binding domain
MTFHLTRRHMQAASTAQRIRVVMPSLLSRSVATAVFVLALTFSAYAHAVSTTPAELLLQALPSLRSSANPATVSPDLKLFPQRPVVPTALPTPSIASTRAPASGASSAAPLAANATLLETLYAQLKPLEAQIRPPEATSQASTPRHAPSCAPLTLSRSLSLGSTGSEVSALQQFLQSQGYYTSPSITGYFGSVTAKAVAAFQSAHGIAAIGSVGPLTSTKIAALSASCASSGGTSSSGALPLKAADAGGNLSTASASAVATTLASSGGGTTPAVVKNIVTNFGAKCDGVADDAPAFIAFDTWALQWQRTNMGLVELDIPSGSKCNVKSYTWLTKGIKKVIVKGYGATLSDNNGAGGFWFGGEGQYQDNLHQARVNTVAAGANSVILKDRTQGSLFTVGNWAFIAGLDLQGSWNAGGYGYPSNAHFFEYVEITSVNSATGQITFSSPLKNTYLSTWPHYDDGGPNGPDQGGPATLYSLHPTWDTEVEYVGLSIESPTAQFSGSGRSVTFRDMTFNGKGCIFPTVSKLWQVIKGTMTNCTMEADKLVEQMVITGTTINVIFFQSSSIDLLIMDNSTVNLLIGTPKKAVISNSTFAMFRPGAAAFGRSDEVDCTNCVVKEFQTQGGVQEKGPSPYVGIQNVYNMSNGVISVPNTMGAVRWAVPGTQAFFEGSTGYAVPFTVTDLTQDNTNTYIHTNLTGGRPPTSIWYPGTQPQLWIHVHPAPLFACTNCTGDPNLVGYAQGPARAPLMSYSKRTYTIGKNGQSGDYFSIVGKLVSIKVNVTNPYTGAQASLLGSPETFVVQSDGSVTVYRPSINLKVAGERDITPTTVTDAQSGDSIKSPGNVWLSAITHWSLPDISTEVPSTWPSVTIEIITDQGVANL